MATAYRRSPHLRSLRRRDCPARAPAGAHRPPSSNMRGGLMRYSWHGAGGRGPSRRGSRGPAAQFSSWRFWPLERYPAAHARQPAGERRPGAGRAGGGEGRVRFLRLLALRVGLDARTRVLPSMRLPSMAEGRKRGGTEEEHERGAGDGGLEEHGRGGRGRGEAHRPSCSRS